MGYSNNTGNNIFNMGCLDGSIGRPDGSRATSLSPVFWHSTFGQACRQDFRRSSRVSWRPDRLRTVSERCSWVLVLEFLTASCLDGPCVHPDGPCSHVTYDFMKLLHHSPRDARTLINAITKFWSSKNSQLLILNKITNNNKQKKNTHTNGSQMIPHSNRRRFEWSFGQKWF
jgi:hypothetical protein